MITANSFPLTIKAINENFRDKELRRIIRKAVLAGEGVPSMRAIGLTVHGKAALEAVKAAYAAEFAAE